jgi:hypothetical protein
MSELLLIDQHLIILIILSFCCNAPQVCRLVVVNCRNQHGSTIAENIDKDFAIVLFVLLKNVDDLGTKEISEY